LTRKEDALATVSDSAPDTTHARNAWHTCGGCGLHAPLPPTTATCPGCGRPAARTSWQTRTDDELLSIYTETAGRIRAWLTMHGYSDADRLAGIREAVADHAREVGPCR
jgi:hypothetical protein